MKPYYITPEALTAFINAAFQEDIGDGDHSTLASVPENANDRAVIVFKQDGLLAGAEAAMAIFEHFDPSLSVTCLKKDGEFVKAGEVAIKVSGRAQSLLTAERLVLNCMQRMSGIATFTQKVTQELAGTSTRLLDTRKTTPCFRMMEKWAVQIGGGQNHRFGLFDLIMLKDNHVDFAGSITEAVNRTVEYLSKHRKKLRIEVETRNLAEVKEALATQKVDIIMLDNMPLDMMKEAVKIINHQCETEASGGITLQTIRSVAQCGVDYVSMGALTYDAPVIDISMKADRS